METEEARVLVTFNVFSDEHLATKITDALGLEADLAIDKGASLGGTAQKAKRTRWTIQEIGYDLNTAEDVVAKLLSRLGEIAEKLHSLPDGSERLLSICLSWYSGDPSPGVRLNAEDLEIFCQNNVSIEIITEVYP